MSYKPGEHDLLAYLYGELEGEEKVKVERYLAENEDARLEFEAMRNMRRTLGMVKDKEVIAPPIFVGDNHTRDIWHTPYLKTVLSIAASLLVLLLAAKLTGLNVRTQGGELRISFKDELPGPATPAPAAPTLTAQQVQDMINHSLVQNNTALEASLAANQKKLDESISRSLAVNSGKIDRLVREASSASQDQIRQYVSGLQAENQALVKNYFQLSAGEQKKYIEGLLVDFAKYLQQQRNNDLQVVQTQLNSMQQNTNQFKLETEQILTSIISTVGNGNSSNVIDAAN